MSVLNRKDIVGARVAEVGHSAYSKLEFVLEGIGPAEFRAHYLRRESGIVLDLFTAEILTSNINVFEMPAETDGIPPDQLIGRRVTGLQRDDSHSSLVILDGLISLCDANDGCYGNSLRAGFLEDDYTPEERAQFADYWGVD
jgi:hypothetical protein